jgi:hypothetical protein
MSRKIAGLDALDDFEPVQKPKSRTVERTVSPDERWPSREPRPENTREVEGALSIKGPARIIDRFKQKTSNGRDIKYYQMLEAMMNFCDRHGFNARVEMMTDAEREELRRSLSK